MTSEFAQARCILILTAVAPEAKAVARRLGLPCPNRGSPASALRSNARIEIHLIGIRGSGLRECRPNSPPSAVIMAGLAGALDPALQIADVVIQGVPQGIQTPEGCHSAIIHTANQIVSTSQEKADLRRQTGASAVEMENAIVSDWVRQQWGADVPVIAIRAISDRADQLLDPALLSIVDPWGRPIVLRLLRLLLLRPRLLPHLIRLGIHSNKAARRLGQAVKEMVELIAPHRNSATVHDQPAVASQSQSSSSNRPSE